MYVLYTLENRLIVKKVCIILSQSAMRDAKQCNVPMHAVLIEFRGHDYGGAEVRPRDTVRIEMKKDPGVTALVESFHG